jgi:hypothetical protein
MEERDMNTHPDGPLPAIEECDPDLLLLARWAQHKLRKNFHKPEPVLNPDGKGRTRERWAAASPSWLMARMAAELEELKAAVREGVTADEIAAEVADILNFGVAVYRAGRNAGGEAGSRPKIVCLCGSTRFYRAFVEANYRETMAGHIVLSVGFAPDAADEVHGEDVGISPEEKLKMDELYKRKIDLADEILVLNVGGYVGQSTQGEIAYARALGKPLRWLEPERAK